MSDPAVQSGHDRDETREKSMQPYQSVWMAHWTRTSFRSVNEAHNQLSPRSESGEDNCDVKHPLDGEPTVMQISSSKFVKGFREVNKGKAANFMNESQATSLKRLRNEASDGHTFPMYRSSRFRENSVVPQNGESSSKHERVVRLRIGPETGSEISFSTAETDTPSMLAWTPSKIGTQTQPEAITRHPEQQVESNKLPKRNSLAVSTPSQVDNVGSTFEIVPYELYGERTTMQTLFDRHDINQPGTTSLVHGKKTNNDAGLFISNCPETNNQLSNFVGKQFRKMNNHSDVELFPSLICPLERSQLEKLHRGHHALPRMRSSADDLETMRIYTTIDSMEEFSRDPPKFITKKTDGGQMFRESAISTKFKGKRVSELFSLSSDFGLHVRQGVKLRPLQSSADSEEKDNVVRVKSHAANLNNESSAETDTMDMDAFCENRLSGVASSSSNFNKDISVSQAAVPSVREEIRGGLLNIDLPDTNQELPVLPLAEGSADDKETSTSRTQSLDVEHLLSHAKQPTDSKSSPCADVPSGLEPFSRWIKRLKSNVSDSFVHGMENSKMEEASSRKKVNELFGKILERGKGVSESKTRKPLSKEQVMYRTAELLRNFEPSSSVSVQKGEDVTLSHAWIQRWCHNPLESAKRKPEAMVVCKPQTSKGIFQKKQFPSIAAMALMGKAMNGFQPCQFRKSGPFVVWNTKRYCDDLT